MDPATRCGSVLAVSHWPVSRQAGRWSPAAAPVAEAMTGTRWKTFATVAATVAATVGVVVLPLVVAQTTGPTTTPGPGGPGIPVRADADPIGAGVLQPSRPRALDVPAIGLHLEQLAGLGLNPDGSLQVPADPTVAGWYIDGPTPGEVGPAVFAGHVNYRRTAGVFSRLHEMRPGQEVVLRRNDATAAVFTVYRVERYPKSAFPTEQVYGDTTGPELRLITCGGDLDAGDLQYLDNVVVYGRFSRAYRD